MSPGARTTYFRFWFSACEVKGWNAKDDELRRAQVLHCMAEVRGPAVTTSDPDFGPDETTALFVYLDHLANQSDLLKAAAWVDCITDYRAYNRARQADWHEHKAYGRKGSGKLRRNRFSGEPSAQGEPLEKFDPEAIRKRHLTMVTRNEARTGYQRKRPARTQLVIGVVDGRAIVGTATVQPVPSKIETNKNPF